MNWKLTALQAVAVSTAAAVPRTSPVRTWAPVTVLLTSDDTLRISVIDGGDGGAIARPGGGLAEMSGRLAGFDATLTLTSPVGGPTQVAASIPMLFDRGETGIGGGTRA